jgi:hypothetical protein
MKVTRGTTADEHGFSAAVQPQCLTFDSQAFAYEVIQELHLGSAQAHRQLCKHIHMRSQSESYSALLICGHVCFHAFIANRKLYHHVC